MQPSTTNINHERVPYKLNVFLFGNEDKQARSVKRFHKYNENPIETGYSIDDDSDDDDDDPDLILSGRNYLFDVCKCVRQVFFSSLTVSLFFFSFTLHNRAQVYIYVIYC